MSEGDGDRCPYVSRGGLKLRAALDAFGIDPAGLGCVDLGCSTGGFTDCLVQAGAKIVFAVDTGYGVLDWKLRNDPRVRVLERENALHVQPPPEASAALDLAVVDIGWTRQALALPAALRWLRPDARIVTLIKPHYEQPRSHRERGDVILSDAEAELVLARVVEELACAGWHIAGTIESPIRGGKKQNKGNREWLSLVELSKTRLGPE